MSDARVNLSDFGLVPELAGLTQVDDAGLLFISPVIHDWTIVSARGIDTVIDLEGGLDVGVPTVPNQILLDGVREPQPQTAPCRPDAE